MNTKGNAPRTPTPWQAEGHYVHGPDGNRFLAVAGDKYGLNPGSAEANAAFIVRACNEYDANKAKIAALTEALETALPYVVHEATRAKRLTFVRAALQLANEDR